MYLGDSYLVEQQLQLVERFKGQAFPGRGAGKARRIKAGDTHDNQRSQKIAEENHQIEPQEQPDQKIAGIHFPISPILTLKARIKDSTITMHTTSSTIA